jgi:hypothetical protein
MTTYWNWKLQEAKEVEIKALHSFIETLTDNIAFDKTNFDISQPQILAIHSRNVQQMLDKYATAKENRSKIEEEMRKIFVETEEGPILHQRDALALHQTDNQEFYEAYLENKTDFNLRHWLKHLIQPYLEQNPQDREIYTIYGNSKIISSD